MAQRHVLLHNKKYVLLQLYRALSLCPRFSAAYQEQQLLEEAVTRAIGHFELLATYWARVRAGASPCPAMSGGETLRASDWVKLFVLLHKRA